MTHPLTPTHHTYCTDWLLRVCADTNTTNSRNTNPSASLQGPSSVDPLCATDCLQQVGLGVPPEHHLSLHLPTAFCLLHGEGQEEGCVITPRRYLQPPAAGGPTEQDSCTTCTELCNTKHYCKYRTANTHLYTTNQIVCSVNVATHQ